MVNATEFFKLFHALHGVEKVGHNHRDVAERIIRGAYGKPEGDNAYIRKKVSLFMVEGLLAMASHCDDSGRRLAQAVEAEMAKQGVRFNVEAEERDEDGAFWYTSFKDAEFDNPEDYEEDEDLGYLKLDVQPGDMSLLQAVFTDYVATSATEQSRVGSLFNRLTMSTGEGVNNG